MESDEDEKLCLVNTSNQVDCIVKPNIISEEIKVLKENEIGKVRQICIYKILHN